MLKKIACFWKIRLLEPCQKKSYPGSEILSHNQFSLQLYHGSIIGYYFFRISFCFKQVDNYFKGLLVLFFWDVFFYWIFFEVFNEKRSDRIACRRRSVFCFCNFDFECCISIKEMVSQRWRVGQKKMICCESEITSQIQ